MAELLPIGTYVKYQIRDALDHGNGAGTIIKHTALFIDGSTRTCYVVQDEGRSHLAPAVLPDEITGVGR